MLCGVSPGFPGLSPARRQVSHVLLTRSPLYSRSCPRFLVRLACVRHAASVDSEPGSNSRLKPDLQPPTEAGGLQKAISCSKSRDGIYIVRSLELTTQALQDLLTLTSKQTISRLARSTCCQRPNRSPPERCVSVEPVIHSDSVSS